MGRLGNVNNRTLEKCFVVFGKMSTQVDVMPGVALCAEKNWFLTIPDEMVAAELRVLGRHLIPRNVFMRA